MGTEANLIVDVEEHNSCAADIKAVCQGLDGAMASLVQHLQAASKTGLKSGQAADSFLTFTSEIARLNGRLGDIGISIASVIANFLGAIDDADDMLFENKGHKPFTDEEFEACYAVAEVTNDFAADGFSITGLISNLINKLMSFFWKSAGWEVTVGNDESILRKAFEDLKEQTVEKLTTIKAGVRSADRTYRQDLTRQLDLLKAYKQALIQIESILAADGGVIDASSLAILSWLIEEGNPLTAKIYTVPDENVKAFAESDNTVGYFNSSTVVIGSICAASMGKWLTSDFDDYRATVNAALDYFNTYSTHYTQSYEQYEKRKAEFDKMLELYNKYGSKWVDHYDGAKEKTEMFNKLVKKTGEVSKKADDYVDIWFQLFCDMSESQEAFARFKANYDLNDLEVCKALERVEALYNGEIDAFAYETLEKISQEVKRDAIEKGAEAVAKAYAKIVPGGGVEKIMTKVTSSILDKAFAEAPAVAQYDWVVATQNSFDNAIADLRTATPGMEGYDTLLKTVRESFDCAKDARIKFFTTMVENSSGQQKRFYELNLESVKTMSLNDASRHIAVSPEEFFGENSSYFGYILDGDISAQLN